MYNPLLCYPPSTPLLGRMLVFFFWLAARSSTVLPYCWGRCYPYFFIRLAARTTVLPPYTAPMLNAASLGAMSVGVLGEPLLCYPVHCTWVKCCLFWCNARGRFERRFPVLPPPRVKCCLFKCDGCRRTFTVLHPLHYGWSQRASLSCGRPGWGAWRTSACPE